MHAGGHRFESVHLHHTSFKLWAVKEYEERLIVRGQVPQLLFDKRSTVREMSLGVPQDKGLMVKLLRAIGGCLGVERR